ncbi:MAG TPA: hypothetical protein VIY48_05185 [Candidatus Paceibacterota bacterium]
MKIVSGPLAAPNICTICKEFPGVEAKVLDTERYIHAIHPSEPLNGRQYVCEKCGVEIAKAFGFVPNEVQQAAVADAENARNEIANVRARVVEIANHLGEFAKHEGAGAEAAFEFVSVVSPAVSAVVEAKKSYEEVFGVPEAPKPRKRAKGAGEVGSAPVPEDEAK